MLYVNTELLIWFPYTIIKYEELNKEITCVWTWLLHKEIKCVEKSNVWRSDYHARKSNLQGSTVPWRNRGTVDNRGTQQLAVIFNIKKNNKIQQFRPCRQQWGCSRLYWWFRALGSEVQSWVLVAVCVCGVFSVFPAVYVCSLPKSIAGLNSPYTVCES